MTQQSLITRLKAVEEALEDAQVYIAVAIHKGSASLIASSSAQEDFDQSEAALSGLRELIKEAEGQRPVGVIEHDTSSYVWEGLIPGTNLYTALGEKPAAAEQQQAKETKE